MSRLPRYRVEDGERCIDLRADTVEELFDYRDPAPFGRRDLDPDVVEYVVGAAEDVASRGPFRVVVWLGSDHVTEDVAGSFHAHFRYELERLEGRLRRQRRTGAATLVVAVALLLAFLALSRVTRQFLGGPIGEGIAEGLVIFGWVALWRPVDVLLYEWLPQQRQRTILRRIVAAPVHVRTSPAAELMPVAPSR